MNCIDKSAVLGENCEIGNFVTIGADCVLGDDVVIHNCVTIYPGVRIGSGTEIFDGAVIGRPPKAAGNLVHKLADSYDPTVIGENCVIGSCVTIYAQCTLGNRVLIGDGARLREGARLEDRTLVAMNCTFNHDVTMEEGSKLIDLSHLTPNTIVGREAFVGCGVITVNDNAMQIRGKEVGTAASIHIGAHARIGSGALILPNMKIGENALVGACSLVSHDVPEGVRVMGIPAKER